MTQSASHTKCLPKTWFNSAGVVLALLFCAAPVFVLALSWLLGESEHYDYFIHNGLFLEYSRNSIIIALGTMCASSVIGIATAWLVSMTEFPMRRLMQWFLIMPLAVPSYIAAIIYGTLLEGAGSIQYALRDITGLAYGEYWFPNIRSIGGVIFILTITLYPYIYMLARAAFTMQSQQMLETARMFGCSGTSLIFRLILPMARPALVAGAALVGMEALADFGVVSLYGVPALTTGIYRAWQGMYDPVAAARMASLLLVVVIAFLAFEKWGRRQAQYYNSTALYHPLERLDLSPLVKWLATAFCLIISLLGAIVPIAVLCIWSLPNLGYLLESSTASALGYSVMIAAATALITLLCATLFAYMLRTRYSKIRQFSVWCATLGYAMPGSVVAVGVLVIAIFIQNYFLGGALLITGTIMAVIWGCSIRFVTIAFHNVQSGLDTITPMMDEAATMLGVKRYSIITRIHVPMMKASLVTAALLVFIDTIKELPATLLLRPFNVSTLSIRVYELAKDDLLQNAAPVGLCMIILSMIAVLYVNKRVQNARPAGASPC